MESTPQLIPLETLFGNPDRAAPKISPDGRRLAYLAPDEGVLNIWLSQDLTPSGRALTKDRGRGIRSYFWAEDGRSLIYSQDKDGDENWHLYLVDAETGAVRDLTPFPGVQAQILATEPNFPDQILAAINVRDKRLHDVYRITLSTGESESIAENPGDVVGWLADSEFKVRACKAMLPNGAAELRARGDDRSPWRSLMTWPPDDTGGAHGFTPGNAGLYVESSLGSDTTKLLEVDIASGEAKEIYNHPEADIGPIALHPTRYHLQAVGVDADRLSWKVIDPDVERDFQLLSSACRGDFQIVSRDDADTRWIIVETLDDRPAVYKLYDRLTGSIETLFSTRPTLEAYQMAQMAPVKITARDGLTLRAYLTLPPNGSGKRHPLILNVHGGPWVRDVWGFNSEVQWLANRGYAVLQVNYRGSMGFGKSFLHAGDREWGAKMQDDLTDAALWAVKQGIADEKRLAIYGGSYGGYAALAGAAFTPDLYCCAVDIVGPSNLETLIRSIPPYWEPMKRIFDLRVGSLEEEPEFLRERSPLFKAHEIRIPLLIAQGANDPRVKQAESEQIVSALREKGKPVEYLLFEDEGHGFARPANRMKFYARAEAFLAKHLGGRSAHDLN